MKGSINFGAVYSSDFSFYILDPSGFNVPEEDYSTFEIPGRSGDLHISNGRKKNVTVTYTCIMECINAMQEFIELRSKLGTVSGYQKMIESYLPSYFWLAKFKSIKAKMITPSKVVFELSFTCIPKLFLESGETEHAFTAAGTIENPTANGAKPIIRIYGSGTFTVGTIIGTINTSGTEYIDIDTDTHQAFEGPIFRNSNVTIMQWGELIPGVNDVTLGTGINKLTVIPRWYA